MKFLLSVLLALVPQWTNKTPEGPTPNVLLIIMDDIGFDDISLVETPSIDQLASNGMTFTRATSQPACAATRFSLMFDEYAETAGPVCFGPNGNTPDVTRPSLPKIFEQRKYSTGFFGKWHLGTNNIGQPWEMTPFLHGFDAVKAGNPSNINANSCGQGPGDYNNWLRFEDGVSYMNTHYHTTAVRNQFIFWWATNPGPKFAMVSFQAAHTPFHDPPIELLPHLPTGGPGYSQARIKFEKMVISIDTVMKHMAPVVNLKNTYIILIGDNGTPPNAAPPATDRNKLKGTLYQGGIHVPFIIAGPGIPKGTVSDSLVSTVDILATLAELIGATHTPIDGVSLLPILSDPDIEVRDHLFSHNIEGSQRQRAVTEQQYKLIRFGAQEFFYDLSVDPDEENALDPSTIDPAIVQFLRDQVQIYIDRGF
jgi:arylsulfatase A-like enzyme